MSTRNDLHKGTSPEPGAGYTHARVDAKNALKAVFALPPDLLAFAHTASVSDVAKVLYTSRRTAYRLRQGYWPADARGLLAAWDSYKGRIAQRQSGWMLRRVEQGGSVRHARKIWVAPALAVCTGQTVAIARINTTRLLAQTLDLPTQRFELQQQWEGAR